MAKRFLNKQPTIVISELNLLTGGKTWTLENARFNIVTKSGKKSIGLLNEIKISDGTILITAILKDSPAARRALGIGEKI